MVLYIYTAIQRARARIQPRAIQDTAYTKVVKHSLKVTEIEAIDDLQLEHSAAFDAVPRVQRPETAEAPLLRASGG